MRSLNISRQNNPGYKSGAGYTGFTLIEVLVVMGILAMLAGLGLFLSFDFYRSYAFRGERDLIITVLQKARSQAINNVCLGAGCVDGKAHGVYFAPGQYVIFQGNDYASRDAAADEVFDGNYSVSVSGAVQVIFGQLSGNASTSPAGSWEIVLSDPSGHTSTTTINRAGQITWTN